MLHIICQDINSGKTTRLYQLFKEQEHAVGYFLIKAYHNNNYIGQDILSLPYNTLLPFSRIEGHTDSDWESECAYLNYTFSVKGLYLAKKIITDIKSAPLFIDEIGPLELLKKGVYKEFKYALNSVNKREIYVTVRKSCLLDVLHAFNITQYVFI